MALITYHTLMKISANEIRVGGVIEHKGKLWNVLKKSHTQPGKGGAFVQVELKSLLDNTKLNERFRSEDKVVRPFLDAVDYQYLYEDGASIVLMHQQTYEQISLNQEILGEQQAFLQENMIVKVLHHDGKPISVEIPDQVVVIVEQTEPVVKGQTATSSYKPACVNGGIRIMVPPHIAVDDKIIVDTKTKEYVARQST